ncbi:xylan glycosyltransferase MUCI21-like [Wolffia australiana]
MSFSVAMGDLASFPRTTMVAQQHRLSPHHHAGDEEENIYASPRRHQAAKRRRHLLQLFSVLCLVSLSLLVGPHLLIGSSISTLPSSICQTENVELDRQSKNTKKEAPLPCSATANNSICCDRSHNRTDVCVIRGDVRTSSFTSSILLFNSSVPPQKIRPYTRKWEASVMNTIDELTLASSNDAEKTRCDVIHDVPAVVFSTGGYTGNVYHEFNDGIIPLFITSRQFNRRVVFLILEYHDWWVTKYKDILRLLSDYPPIDFSKDNRTHCFPETTVGLRIHGELAIDPSENLTIFDFRRFLDDSFRPRISEIQRSEKTQLPVSSMPKLAIISRNGSRGLENEDELVALCKEIGFEVQLLRPDKTTELAKMYRALNSSDVMFGVHGAAMTHLLFMRPGAVFIQVVALGTDWAAEAFYGSPAKKLGLEYIAYKIKPHESSLSRLYKKDDPVLVNPDAVNSRGWEVTKRVYLDGQTVRLDLNRLRKHLTVAYRHVVGRKMEKNKNLLPPRSTQ